MMGRNRQTIGDVLTQEQSQTWANLRGLRTPERARELILDYLCYDQIAESAWGQDAQGDWAEFTWTTHDDLRDDYWAVKICEGGKIHKSTEYGGLEHTVRDLSDSLAIAVCDHNDLWADPEDYDDE